MSERVKMPALGESVTEGTVTRWLKQVGDRIELDEPLLEVSTDKVDTEIPSPIAGTLTQVIVAENETVPVGADLAVISPEGAEATAAPVAAPATEAPVAAPAVVAPVAALAPPIPDAAAPAVAPPAPAAASDPGTSVRMPALGESVTEGTVTRWLKAVGDSIELDEPLLEVSTDKVDTEIPSPAAGVLSRILVGEDETVAVGAELALIGGGLAPAAPSIAAAASAAAAVSAPVAASPPAASYAEVAASPAFSPAPLPTPAPAAPVAAPTPVPQPIPDAGASDLGSVYVTPLVRKLAAEHGVNLATVVGTGVGGRVRKQDVLDAAAPPAAPSPAAAASASVPAAPATGPAASKRGTTEKLSRLRKVIAQRMVESLQTSAQLTSVVEVDVTKIARLRDRAKVGFKAREGVGLSFLPFFAQAAIEALKVHPTINASLNGEEVTYHAVENLGIAVDTEKGLIVPVIKEAGTFNIAGIARKVADLAERTRSNRISPDELGGGTFTLTNTGSRGALFDTPIVNLPQVAILGTGAVVKRPVVVRDMDGGETIAIRSMVYLSLSYDHRIVDGADAARFLVTMKDRLEEGAFEADLGL